MARQPANRTTTPAAAPSKKRQVMIVHYHQARKTIFWVGAYRKDGEHGSVTHPKEVVINLGRNFISDPDVVAALLADSAFQDSIAATEKQKKKGRTLKGIEIELYDAPTPKATIAVEAEGDEEDDEKPKVNMWEKVPPVKMIETIKACVDVDRLEEMKAVETRANVSAAIVARIGFLRKDAKKARGAGADEGSDTAGEE